MTDIEYLKKYYKGNMIGYNFDINKDCLIPRFETEQLIEKTINYINKLFNKKIDIVDLGTGSGCIAITLKKELDCNVTAVDISNKALKIARGNANKNNCLIDFLEGDMLKPLNKKYDLIISNPPYISRDEKIMDIVKNNEPHIALYADKEGLYYYEEILKKNYLIAFEIGQEQANKIKEMAKLYLYHPYIKIEKDLQGLDRFVFITNGEEI